MKRDYLKRLWHVVVLFGVIVLFLIGLIVFSKALSVMLASIVIFLMVSDTIRYVMKGED